MKKTALDDLAGALHRFAMDRECAMWVAECVQSVIGEQVKDRVLGLLRKLQYEKVRGHGDLYVLCRVCGREACKPDCELAAMIKELEG